MYECMPYYYRLTEGHGQGAEHMMVAEAAFDRGMDADALIAMEKAVDAAKRHWNGIAKPLYLSLIHI